MLLDRGVGKMAPRITEVDREELTEGEHVEFAIEGTAHRIYVTAVEGQTVCVVGNNDGEQASISLTDEKWRLNEPEKKER